MAYVYAGFGEGETGTASVTGKTPFYTQPDPVAACIKAIQKVLGVPITGVWDPATHAALWNYVTTYLRQHSPEVAAQYPPVLPWRSKVCVSDGLSPRVVEDTLRGGASGASLQPSESGSEDACVPTSLLILVAMEVLVKNEDFIRALGWNSKEEMQADMAWAAMYEEFDTKFMEHIDTKLSESPGEVTPTNPPPPVVVAECKPKTASLAWFVGGLAVAGLLFFAFSRRKGTPAMPVD